MRGESKQALTFLLDGLHLTDSLNLLKPKADFLFSIGNYFRLQHNVDASIDYLDQAGELYQEMDMHKEYCGKVLYTKASTYKICLLYTSPSPRDATLSRMPSSA